ncbi:8-amino-7-oxononanoate synthase [plant metagenome]|uniref:8-amino-7-oxononanoate synthase n=1 Tax=plant metagenome TaxID=1297885 RepID=A0A484QAY2_9ZZZZ
MSLLDPLFHSLLAQADARRMRRVLRPLSTQAPAGHVLRDGTPLVDFSSNDYLGLARDPAIARQAARCALRHGAGARASRLVTGTLDLHAEAEAAVAAFKGTEAALLLASGWQANAAALPALIGAVQGPALVYTDRLIHASLHAGCAQAGVRQIRYRHNDLDHLEHLLAERAQEPGQRFIVTESVFSMDGDQADVPALAALAERHGAFLYLDEAHATGVLGPQGRGLAAQAGGRVDLVMGTFSKAAGGFGAYIAGSRALCDYLVNTCSGFIYSTALPPAVVGAVHAAVTRLPGMDAERAHLHALATRLRAGLADIGIDTGLSSTQIVPAIVGDAGRALALADALAQAGMLVGAIRPPTVPAGTSRLRIALSSLHTAGQVDALVTRIRDSRGPCAGAGT